MEALQYQLEGLRILSIDTSADDQAEAHYRGEVYANYEDYVETLSSTTDSINYTAKEVSTCLEYTNYNLELYSHFLKHMDTKTDQQAPSACLQDILHITNHFDEAMELFFCKQIWTEMSILTSDQWSVEDAIDLLDCTLSSSCEDRILDREECLRLLQELSTRRVEIVEALKGIVDALEGIEVVISEVQDRAERLYGDVVRSLQRSKVKDEERCEGVCLSLQKIGDLTRNTTVYWDMEAREGEEDEDEDDFKMEG